MKTSPWYLWLASLVSMLAITLAYGAICLSQTGCAGMSGTPTDPNLTFAQTVQNIIQDANTGAAIIKPDVNALATASLVFAHTPQQVAILNKIIAVSNTASAPLVAQSMPATVIQDAVSAVNTPAAAAAIVQQVEATVSNPAAPAVDTTPPVAAPTSMLRLHPDIHPRAREGWLCWQNVY